VSHIRVRFKKRSPFCDVLLIGALRNWLAGAFHPAATQRLVKRGLLSELGPVEAQQGLLRSIERSLCIKHRQTAVDGFDKLTAVGRIGPAARSNFHAAAVAFIHAARLWPAGSAVQAERSDGAGG
jgi:hypothetical protein